MHRFIFLLLIASLTACDAIQGPKGDTGSQGLQGDQGVQGIQGIKGEKGDKGDKGDQGIQGLTGGGLYVAHSSLYCRTVTGATVAGGLTLHAKCDSYKDLGLTGSCEISTVVGQGLITGNRPLGWDADGATPEWQCNFTVPDGVTPVDLPSAAAHICCIKVP